MPSVSKARTLISVVDAVTKFDSIAREDNRFIAFRGQRNVAWKLKPAITRPELGLSASESEIIRELLSVHPEEFRNDGTMFDRLVRMQHHGLPTRLIDVTANPLVALYFASEPAPPGEKETDGVINVFDGPLTRRKYFDSDTVSCLANLANLTEEEKTTLQDSAAKRATDFNRLKAADRLLQFIRSEKPYFRPRIAKVDLVRPCYVVPKMSNRRLVAQFGSFIIQGLDRDAAAYERDIKNATFVVAKDEKEPIRQQLNRLGINEGTLFPEIDRTANQIKLRFKKVL